ncbi:hypothetical protein J437_LFUL018509 [Ladona fulva]|uniref:Peptidase S1 domain-containing protein n=1 Tax=Ladona fulva TaxID=123851 RepID=A0A8K0P491_LADFU|nr:hypothetical protein J437_LFUL018509 [Ladona fulva]
MDKPLQKKHGNDTESKIHPTGRIIDGAPALRGQFPYQVVVYMDNSYMCGGSIISSQWILTAAHCALGFKNFVIIMGTTDRTKYQSGQQTAVTNISIVNSMYNKNNYNNDIAVLRVPTILFSPFVSPVQLPKATDSTKSFTGQAALVSGFGVTASGTVSNTLQYAAVNVISNYQCQQVFGTSYVAPTNICTKNVNNSKGTCNGDSGGPLVYLEGTRYTEIGIVSFGIKGCKGAPSAYTRVTSYLGWISQKTGIVIRK